MVQTLESVQAAGPLLLLLAVPVELLPVGLLARAVRPHYLVAR